MIFSIEVLNLQNIHESFPVIAEVVNICYEPKISSMAMHTATFRYYKQMSCPYYRNLVNSFNLDLHGNLSRLISLDMIGPFLKFENVDNWVKFLKYTIPAWDTDLIKT